MLEGFAMLSPREFLLTLFTSLIQLILFITIILLLWNPVASKGTYSAVHPLLFLIMTIATPIVVVSPASYLGYALQRYQTKSVFLSITPVIGLILLLFLKAVASFPARAPAIGVGFALWVFLFLTIASLALIFGKKLRARARERSAAVRRSDHPVKLRLGLDEPGRFHQRNSVTGKRNR
jgi:hypothetical protein